MAEACDGRAPRGRGGDAMPPRFIGMVPARPAVPQSHVELGEVLFDSVVKTLHPELSAWRSDTQRDCVVQSVLGANLIAQLPTGFGKSLIAIVPAVAQGGLTLFVAPTLSLVGDLYRECRDRQILAFELTGASSHDQQMLTYEALMHLQGGIVFTTPEKAGSQQMSALLCKLQVSRVVVDEAHCCDRWASWRPAYDKMGNWLRILVAKGVPVTFLSATISAPFYARIPGLTGLDLQSFFSVFLSVSRSNLVCDVERKPSFTTVVDIVRTRFEEDTGSSPKGMIVFCRSARQCVRLADALGKTVDNSGNGMPCAAYYGSLPIAERKATLQDWKCGKFICIAGTEALAVGVNHPALDFVVHNGLPDSPCSFAQHIGRAARLPGQSGRCLLLASPAADAAKWAALSSLPKRDGGTPTPHANTGQGEQRDAGGFGFLWSEGSGDNSAAWPDLEFVPQDSLERIAYYISLSESCLLFLRAELGGCIQQQTARHFRPETEWHMEKRCGGCKTCAAVLSENPPIAWTKYSGAGVDVTWFVTPFVELVRSFGSVGVEHRNAAAIMRWHIQSVRVKDDETASRAAKAREVLVKRLDDAAAELGSTPELIVSLAQEKLSRLLPAESIKFRMSDANVFFISCVLVAEERWLRWRAVKGSAAFSAKLYVVCADTTEVHSRAVYISREGPRN